MKPAAFDILPAGRAGVLQGRPSFSLRNRALRAAWTIAWLLLAAWTPAPMHRWRVVLLRLFGGQVGRRVQLHRSVRIWSPRNLTLGDGAVLGPRAIVYNIAPIRIGPSAIISQGAHLCTGSHDIDDPEFQLRAAPINIGPKAWIAAEAFVGPGVAVGEGSVLGARGVAMRDLAPWMVYAGNPARLLRPRRR